jgi:hypothetical protein
MGFFDFFKKKSDYKEEGDFFDQKYCINCAALIPKGENICHLCHHNQDYPIIKRQLDIATAVNSALYVFYDPNTHKSLSEGGNKFITEFSAKNKYLPVIINELFFMELSLLYILFLSYFDEHPKNKDIIVAYQSGIDKLLLDLFEKENLEEIMAFFYTRVKQFYKGFVS